MSVIKLHTVNERLMFDSKPVITSGNIDIDSISVTLCGNWREVGETADILAVFYRDEGEKLKRKLENGSCMIPNEMLIDRGFFYIGIYAENANGERVKTSNIVEYEVRQGTATTAETKSRIVANAQAEYLTDLANSLETATGEDHTGKTWDELNEEVQNMSHEVTIDLSDYVKHDEMPEIDVDDVVSVVSGSVNIYPAFSADKWKDNYLFGGILIDDENYCYSSSIPIKPNKQYRITHNNGITVSDQNGAPFEIRTEISLGDGETEAIIEEYSFYTRNTTAEVKLTIDKREFGGTTDINTAVENFNSVFMLVEGNTLPTEFVPYVKGGYKLKENVELPDNIKIPNVPTKVSELENDSGFITKADIPTDESYELIGETPLTLAEKLNIKLENAGETKYEAKTPTIWNFDDVFASGDYTLAKCTLERENDHYKLTSGDTVTAHYQSYVKILIPVEAGKTYTLTWDNTASKKDTKNEPIDWGGFIGIYDGEDTSKLLNGSLLLDEIKKYTFTPTTNIVHIRFYSAKSDKNIKAGCVARFNSLWLNEGETSSFTEPYNVNGTFNGSITLQKVPKGSIVTATPTAKVYTKAPTDKTLSKADTPADAQATGERIEAVKNLLPLYGKTIVNFGDSIFGNAQPPVDISTHLANKTGATVYNCGFGGCRMTPHERAEYAAFSMCNLSTAIATNDFTLQENAVSSTTVTLNDAIKANFARLKTIDFSNVDIVTIAYGTNDYHGNGATLDNEENLLDVSTFGGALRYSIETLLNKYPNLRIFILSITYRFWTDENNEFVDDSHTHANNYGKFISDYNAKLKEVAEEYNLPFVDDYNIGIGKFNRYQYFSVTDGTHQNETGRRLIASHLAKELY